jgi:hypothetical protein
LLEFSWMIQGIMMSLKGVGQRHGVPNDLLVKPCFRVSVNLLIMISKRLHGIDDTVSPLIPTKPLVRLPLHTCWGIRMERGPWWRQ